MMIRNLGGVIRPFCQSCNQRPAVLSVRWPDFVIAVCYECRPVEPADTPAAQPAVMVAASADR